MRRVVIISLGATVVVGLAAGGVGVWASTRAQQPESVASVGGTIALDTNTEGKSNMVALPEDQPGQPVSDQSASTQSGQKLSVSDVGATGSGDSRSSGASDFAQYEQYKDSQNALFGDLSAGTGATVGVGSKLVVHYRGWLTNGQVFDESYGRGQPFEFTIGEHRVIAGWETGLMGMKAGGKRRLIVPPAVGYGNQTMGAIPAGSVLVFDVELLQVQ